MTIVSNDPSRWPFINIHILDSYWHVVAGFVVVYDWGLTLGQEIGLIWGQRWSLMTVLYLIIRYIGMPYFVINALEYTQIFWLTDAGCNIMGYAENGISEFVFVMLGIIMISRLYAMYQGSRMMLIFLVIIFLAVNIAYTVISTISNQDDIAEELILSGIHMCGYRTEGDSQLLSSMTWMLATVWEVLTLCLSVWIAVKHFNDLRRLGPSTGLTLGDCFRVLIKSHVLYFASFAGVSCMQFAIHSLDEHSNSMTYNILSDAYQILSGVQRFVLGPRLILGVREYHAKLVAESDAETSMNSIVFQERVYIPTSSSV